MTQQAVLGLSAVCQHFIFAALLQEANVVTSLYGVLSTSSPWRTYVPNPCTCAWCICFVFDSIALPYLYQEKRMAQNTSA